MPYPHKFRTLIETKRGEIAEPVEAWITYAVCVSEPTSCGWGGWILEAARGEQSYLPAKTDQICPNCGKELFRTEVSVKLAPSQNQEPPVQDSDYESLPIEYE